ncbi:hypothetical protein QMG25_15440 [Arthrobacter sp. H35-D1]|nr:hypothetical protein [Arthrobacter sp. H35-D1]
MSRTRITLDPRIKAAVAHIHAIQYEIPSTALAARCETDENVVAAITRIVVPLYYLGHNRSPDSQRRQSLSFKPCDTGRATPIQRDAKTVNAAVPDLDLMGHRRTRRYDERQVHLLTWSDSALRVFLGGEVVASGLDDELSLTLPDKVVHGAFEQTGAIVRPATSAETEVDDERPSSGHRADEVKRLCQCYAVTEPLRSGRAPR